MTEIYRKLVGNGYSRDFRSIAEIVESELVDPEAKRFSSRTISAESTRQISTSAGGCTSPRVSSPTTSDVNLPEKWSLPVETLGICTRVTLSYRPTWEVPIPSTCTGSHQDS